MNFLTRWLVTTVATAFAIWMVPGIQAVGGPWAGPIACALFLALVNTTIKPVAQILSLPLTMLTMGIFYLIVNALMFELASFLSTTLFGIGIRISGFGSAFLGAIVISIVSVIIGGALDND